jgi:hypothetical protein
MNTQSWGHCKHCKHFGSPAQIPLSNEEARCQHPSLSRYDLVVFGASGCSQFELRQGLERGVEAMRTHIEPP